MVVEAVRRDRSSPQEFRITFSAESGQGATWGGQYQVVAIGPDGEMLRSPFVNPLDPREVESALASIAGAGRGLQRSIPTESLDPVRDLGSRLYEALFRGSIERAWAAALSAGGETQLRLVLDGDETAAIPWEFLYDRRRGDFLVLSTRTPLVRAYRDRPVVQPSDVELLELPEPVKVLAVASDVTGAWQVDRELNSLSRLLVNRGGSTLVVKTPATWLDCLAALHEEQPHVLHLIVHGVARPSQAGPLREQSVAFLAEGGSGLGGGYQLRSVDELADEFRSAPRLSLVVFNGCRTDGVAARLAVDLPAVVGLRGDITDMGAVTFAEGLYGALCNGVPLDAAMSTARLRIDTDNPGGREWCSPVLYQRPARLAFQTSQRPGSYEVANVLPASAAETSEPVVSDDNTLNALHAMVAIQETNLGVLSERSRSLGDATPPYITQEIEATRRQIEQLVGEIAAAERNAR